MVKAIKQCFMRLISCMLVIALLLPTVNLLPVSAEVQVQGVSEEKIYDLKGTMLIPNVHPIDMVRTNARFK